MKFSELKKSLNMGDIRPSYLLTGDDGYLIELARKMFEGLVTVMPELNLLYLKRQDLSPSDITNALESLPFMAEKKVIIIDEYSGNCQDLEKYLARPNESSVLVIISPELTSNLAKVTIKSEVVDCSRLEAGFLKAWISRNVAEMGGEISEAAANLLILFCNRYLSRIRTELMKLCAYKKEGVIEPEDIEAVVVKDNEYKIFELSEALTKRDSSKAADVLLSLTSSGTPIPVFMGMLYSHFRRLFFSKITADKSSLAKELGVKEYAVKMAEQAAKNYSPRELKKICDCFHKMDYNFKNGFCTDKVALDTLIFTALS